VSSTSTHTRAPGMHAHPPAMHVFMRSPHDLHTFLPHSRLRVDPEDHSVVIAEQPWSLPDDREALAEV
jgi:hypothetical protein